MKETNPTTSAFGSIEKWAKELFADQFETRWHFGFIHCALSSENHFGHRSFVTYRSGKGEWVPIELKDDIVNQIRSLIIEKAKEKDRINSLRIYAWANRSCEFDFLTDPSVPGYFAVAPVLHSQTQEESVKDLIIRDCLYFLDFNETKAFQVAQFEFHRISIRVCATVRVIDLYGTVRATEFEVGAELELLIIRLWAANNMKRRHLLQIAFDESFMVKVNFLDSYILKTLEIKCTGDIAK